VALADEVALRYPAQSLVELTNPRSPEATVLDATKMAQAVTSVEGWFRIHVQAEPDVADAQMLEVLVDGVIATLQKWGGNAAGVRKIKWDAWIESCKALRGIGSRARLSPSTNSTQEPTPPDATQKPVFDDAYYDELTPGGSGGSGSGVSD
jgi:hypothetical protein